MECVFGEGEDLVNAPWFSPVQGCPRQCDQAHRRPKCHRKVLAKATVAAFRPELQQAAGDAQHASMAANGTLRMAQQVQRHLHRADHDAIYIRTDIRNAFNEVNRQAALDALRRAHPTLGAVNHAWLHRPTTAVLQAQEGQRTMMTTHAGIPQGDPLSSLAFGLAPGRATSAPPGTATLHSCGLRRRYRHCLPSRRGTRVPAGLARLPGYCRPVPELGQTPRLEPKAS